MKHESFAHMECRFDKIKDLFQGFGSLVSLRLQKDGGTKSKQIWQAYHTETQAAKALVVRIYFSSIITRNVTLAFQCMEVLRMGKNVNGHFN